MFVSDIGLYFCFLILSMSGLKLSSNKFTMS